MFLCPSAYCEPTVKGCVLLLEPAIYFFRVVMACVLSFGIIVMGMRLPKRMMLLRVPACPCKDLAGTCDLPWRARAVCVYCKQAFSRDDIL